VIALADRINDALPQTQCKRCGFPDCKAYAQAIAIDNAPINQCPPGGLEGVTILSKITGRPVLPLNPDNGTEGPMTVAVIDEAWCIGCTLCLKVCPTDAILGSNKVMHTVIEAACTGCDLCFKQQASRQQSKAEMKLADLATHTRFDADKEMARKRAIIEAALAKAKARQKS